MIDGRDLRPLRQHVRGTVPLSEGQYRAHSNVARKSLTPRVSISKQSNKRFRSRPAHTVDSRKTFRPTRILCASACVSVCVGSRVCVGFHACVWPSLCMFHCVRFCMRVCVRDRVCMCSAECGPVCACICVWICVSVVFLTVNIYVCLCLRVRVLQFVRIMCCLLVVLSCGIKNRVVVPRLRVRICVCGSKFVFSCAVSRAVSGACVCVGPRCASCCNMSIWWVCCVFAVSQKRFAVTLSLYNVLCR